MNPNRYTKVIGELTPLGFTYRISDDFYIATTKDDCLWRISQLPIHDDRKRELRRQLKGIKRLNKSS